MKWCCKTYWKPQTGLGVACRRLEYECVVFNRLTLLLLTVWSLHLFCLSPVTAGRAPAGHWEPGSGHIWSESHCKQCQNPMVTLCVAHKIRVNTSTLVLHVYQNRAAFTNQRMHNDYDHANWRRPPARNWSICVIQVGLRFDILSVHVCVWKWETLTCKGPG